MNILDIIKQTQGGGALGKIGEQFGLDDKQTGNILEELMPKFGDGVKEQSRQKGGLENIFDMLQDDNKNRYADDANGLQDDSVKNVGNDILGGFFGNKEGSRQVAKDVAAKTGVSDSVIKGMLPYIAPIVIGALSKKILGNKWGRIVGSALSGRRGTMSSRLGRTLGSSLFKMLGSGFVMKFLGKMLMKRMFK